MYENILSPISIRGNQMKNRFVMTAMHNGYSERGILSERAISYYEARAKGGWGMITTEVMDICPAGGSSFENSLNLYDPKSIEDHKKLTERVHRYGAKIIAQLYYGGMVAKRGITGQGPVAPYPIKDLTMPEMARELTLGEIGRIVQQFGEAAVNAEKAGYDGIEIHGANRYLVFSFVSPLINKRTDMYGGSISGRARFPIEIVKEIRSRVSQRFIISYKMSVADYAEGGQSLTESQMLARLLEKAGVDIICCAQGGSKTRNVYIPSYHVPQGAFIKNTEMIKQAVSVPVMANGRIVDPEMGDLFIALGKTDFIAMGRAALADPDMPEKLYNDRTDEIYRCIGCHQGCIGELDRMKPVRCLLNPLTGEEGNSVSAAEKKEVWVIGGGIAGSEAAIWAAKRGHHVILWEKTDRLGGQWNAACVPPGKADFAQLIIRQRRLLQKYGVDIRLNHEVSKSDIAESKADQMILAAGSIPRFISIPGINEIPWAYAVDILRGHREVINRAVEKKDCVVHAATAENRPNIVVIGGGMAGAETAMHLNLHGSKVFILEAENDIARDVAAIPRKDFLDKLHRTDIQIIVSAQVIQISQKTVYYRQKSMEYKIEDVDMVILAVGSVSNHDLDDALEQYQGEVITIGDAESVKDGLAAVTSGYRAGIQI